MIQAEIDSREAERMLARVGDAGLMPKVVRQVGEAAEQLIRGTFRSETDPWGTPWPNLSPLTLAARRRKGRSGVGKLVDEAVMYRSLDSAPQGDEAVISIGGAERFPGVHQFGNEHIPARPMFPITSAGVEIPGGWWQSLTEPLDTALRKATA